jgi:DNA-binding IclR family transcriptional regulator
MTGPAPIKVISNATDLIDLLAWEGPQSPADIAGRIGVPRSSVYRLIEGLVAIAMVENTEDSRVRLTSRWLHLADAARAGMVEWAGADAVLDRLVDDTGQTAFLTVRRDDRAVCIDWRQGRGIGVLALKPGRSLPLYAGAAGRVLLAFGGPGGVLDSAPHRALTPSTLTTRAQLEIDIARTLEQGYTVSDEDVTVGITAIGMPIIDSAGDLVGGISLGGLSSEVRAGEEPFRAALGRARDALAALHGG